MKKGCLFATIAFFSMFSVHAQNQAYPPKFGIKGGINFSSVAGDYFENPDTKIGFYAGILVEIPLNNRYSIQPEVLYSQENFSAKGLIIGKKVQADYKMDYIRMPVVAKIYLTNGLNFQIGPQIGIRVNEGIQTSNGPTNFGTAENFIGLGVLAGLEYKFDNGIFIQARYNYGLTEIYKNVDAHNTTLQVGIGYFLFGRKCGCGY